LKKTIKSKRKNDLPTIQTNDETPENYENLDSESLVEKYNSTNKNFKPISETEKKVPLIVWEAPVFEEINIPSWIKYIVISLFVLFEVYSAINLNFSSFFVLIGFSLFLYIYLKTTPEIVQQEIGSDYIKIDGETFEFSEIKRFWITYNENIQEITFVVNGKFFNPKSSIGSVNPNFLRELLKNKVKEVEPEPITFADLLSKILHL